MKVNGLFTLLCFIGLVLFMTSCKKDDQPTQDEIDLELLQGNWELHGVDDDGSFTMHLKFNSDKTGTTDMYEFVNADFSFELTEGKLTMTFDGHPDFSPNPAFYSYTFIDKNNLSLVLLESGVENKEYTLKWERVK